MRVRPLMPTTAGTTTRSRRHGPRPVRAGGGAAILIGVLSLLGATGLTGCAVSKSATELPALTQKETRNALEAPKADAANTVHDTVDQLQGSLKDTSPSEPATGGGDDQAKGDARGHVQSGVRAEETRQPDEEDAFDDQGANQPVQREAPVEAMPDNDAGGARDQLEPAPAAESISSSRDSGPSWAQRRALHKAGHARSELVKLLAPLGGSAHALARGGGWTASGLSCPRTCELAEAICTSSEAICDVARSYPNERDLPADCEWAEQECEGARALCTSCGGGY